VAAVLFALPAGYTLVGVMLVYPWFTIPATIIVCAFVLDRRIRRRAAIAARADWEYRQEMVRALKTPIPAPPRQHPRNVMNRWPTTPMPTIPIGCREVQR
jgi:hypothetical protein